jgi:hypothetical protein
MSMMDLQAALGGGGGAPGGPPPGPYGAGGGPMPEQDPGQPMPGQDQPDPQGASGGSLDLLQSAEDSLHQFIQVDPDDADKAEASKALQIILKLKATNQQDAQEGGMKSLSRALAGA